MANTTLTAIMTRFQTVCEGASLRLAKTTDEFSFERQPNLKLNNVYRLEDGGLSESQSQTSNVDMRVDQIDVWLARKATPSPVTERATLETTIRTLERALIADGPGNSYQAFLQDREIERVGDVIVARVAVLVDYDYSLT